ncbi:hypothetical protein L6452_16321 [Arctium lappa]|uniref:Uncharacterized protein n=1 Tax=Arctium lappa TaxID=4217 RepID=A0ACB9C0E1_ARCLA|nr:hypothetical protein L6452_16321 [Arctium lappa]
MEDLGFVSSSDPLSVSSTFGISWHLGFSSAATFGKLSTLISDRDIKSFINQADLWGDSDSGSANFVSGMQARIYPGKNRRLDDLWAIAVPRRKIWLVCIPLDGWGEGDLVLGFTRCSSEWMAAGETV